MNSFARKLITMFIPMALTGNVVAASCIAEIPKPEGNLLRVNGVGSVSLGPADNDAHPAAWQGPLSAGGCTLDVGIIEAPFLAARPGSAYVTTYSGAMRSVALVDFGACKILWQSKPFVGPVQVKGAALKLGKRRLALDEHCVPKARR